MRAPANPPASKLGRLALSFVALMLATTLAGASAVADELAGHAADMVAASELASSGDDDAAAGEALAGDGVRATSDGDSADDGRAASDGVSSSLAGQLSLELPLASALGADEPDGPGAPATLAGYLAGGMLRVSADVALAAEGEDVEPVVGSFTVDGLTYAVTGEGEAALVAVSPRTLAGSLVEGAADGPASSSGAPSGEDSGSGVPTSPSPSPEGASSDEVEGAAPASVDTDVAGPAGEPAALSVPDSVEHGGVAYAVTAVGPRAFAGCDADAVVLPASVASVDQAAFDGSSVAIIEVAEGNPSYSSYDGMLFDADMTCLLLIPEGKQGAALVPESAEGVLADALSHSGPAEPSSAGGGGAAFSSRNGCLYDESGEALVWAPPGSAGAASLAAGADGEADGLPAASLGEAASSRSATDITVTCATDEWVWYDKPQGVKDEFRQSYGPGVSRKMTRGTCTKVRLIPMSSSLGNTYGVAGHYVTGTGNPTVDASAWRWYVRAGTSLSAMTVETGATIVWADGKRERMLVGETYEAKPGMRIELHRGVDVKVSLWGKDGSSSSRIEDVYAVNGSAMPAVTPPTRAGYRFMGYYTGASGSGTRYYDASGKSDRTMSQKTELKLYASWAKEVTLTWESNGGSAVAPTAQALTDGAKLALPAQPTRSGYTFKGWFTARTGGAQVTFSTALPSSNTTYYARWEPNVYKMAFDRQGGTGGADAIYQRVGDRYYLSAACTDPWTSEQKPLLVASRTGYTFGGYFTDPGGKGTRFSWADGQISHTAADIPVGSRTLYAAWEPNIYKVTLDKQGGTGGMDAFWLKYAHWASSKPDASDNIGSLPSLPTRAGYDFMGYFTEPGGKGTRWVNPDGGWAIGSTACTADTKLYAHWRDSTWSQSPGGASLYRCEVREGRANVRYGGFLRSFDASGAFSDAASSGLSYVGGHEPGGTEAIQAWHVWAGGGAWVQLFYDQGSNQGVYYQRFYDLGNDPDHPSGYHVTGWELNGRLLSHGDWLPVEGASTLAARTEPNTYSVRYDGNGATGGATDPTSHVYDADGKLAANGFSRTGWTFKGWATSPSGAVAYASGATARNLTKANNATVTLYAKWEPNVYEVALDRQGGTGGPGTLWMTYAHHASLSKGGPDDANPLPSVPTRAGYSFAGYFTEREGKGRCHIAADGRLLMGNTAYASNVTLYAHWVTNLVTVHANGHELSWSWSWRESGSAPVSKVDSGKLAADGSHAVECTRYYGTDRNDVTVDEIIPYSWFKFWGDVPGWTCVGFNTDPRASEGLPFAFYQDAVDLYAIWRPNVYEVTLDKQGGTGGSDRFWFKYAHWASLDPSCPEDTGWVFLEPPTREPGYRFAGYWTEPGGKGQRHVLADGRMVIARDQYASDTTIYAHWEGVPFAISYDCAGGELAEGARGSYTIEDAFDLPAPTRYGYQFDGWDVAGVGEGGSAGSVLGAGVEDATAEDGSKVTRVKAGTYGDLACTARWTLRYDLDVPVADPGEVTFEADSLTGQVRVRPGTSAEGAILSYMAVPVALDSLSCEGLDSTGQPDAAGGAPELEAIFGAGSAAKVLFTATVGEGDAPHVARLTAGGASGTASLAGLSVPAATSHDAPGRIPVSYGLELDSGLAIPPVRDAAPVARLTWTVSLPAAGA